MAQDKRFQRALAVPLLRFLGAEPADAEDPTSGINIEVTPDNVNAVNAFHGGAIATVLDVAAYLALLPELGENEEAITHALFVNYLSAGAIGDCPRATARVVRKGRRIAFVASELRAGERLIATAQVTKSVLAYGRPLQCR
jgi:uncharacterized protein (TIGR00369 family)